IISITKEQQQALDDALVPREQRLRIGNCNYRLSTTFKPKEPTFQVALDVLSLTPFYQAFLITASVPAIYMHELWATKFVDPPFEEEIIALIRELSYSGNVKSLSNIKVDTLPQPWRTFGTIINKCLSGKVIGLNLHRLSRAQILWGMYHQKYVDYVYLLWEDLVYQLENKVSKKNKDMYYPRFTKVIINHFMSQDQTIPRRNKVDWHIANDDPILTTMRFILQHEVVQKYGAILPDSLTNQAMKELEAYKTYYDLAAGKVALKPKYVRQSTREKTKHAPKASSGVDEGTGVSLGVPDVPTYGSEDELVSWKSSEEENDKEVSISKDDDDNDVNEKTESDNDVDDFVHPKFLTHYQEERQNEEDIQEESSDIRVQTPSHYESTDDEDSEVEIQGANVEGEEMDEEETNEEEEVDELYRDVNVNLEGRDTEMTDALRTIVQTTQVIEDTHVIITLVNPKGQQQSSYVSSGFISNMLNPSPDTCIDSIFNLNIESNYLVDVSVTTIAETPLSFDYRLKTLENDFLEFNQTNQFAVAVSLIPSIVDTYLAKKMNEAIKTVVQLQSDRLRDEAQADNEDFINKLDDNIMKIIKDAPKEKTSKTTGKTIEGAKSHHKSVGESAQAEEPMHTARDLKEPTHQEFKTGVTEDQPDEDTSQLLIGFRKQQNLLLPIMEDPRYSFNELMDTHLDFSTFVMNQLKVDTLTPELLTGLTFKLMNGSCKSLVELEYFLEEVYKATTDRIDRNNPEGQQYPHDLRKPLLLILNYRDRQVIPFATSSTMTLHI
ncbi:hypothetical protein Tco_1290479, partial [Tanacetum coccineum]